MDARQFPKNEDILEHFKARTRVVLSEKARAALPYFDRALRRAHGVSETRDPILRSMWLGALAAVTFSAQSEAADDGLMIVELRRFVALHHKEIGPKALPALRALIRKHETRLRDWKRRFDEQADSELDVTMAYLLHSFAHDMHEGQSGHRVPDPKIGIRVLVRFDGTSVFVNQADSVVGVGGVHEVSRAREQAKVCAESRRDAGEPCTCTACETADSWVRMVSFWKNHSLIRIDRGGDPRASHEAFRNGARLREERLHLGLTVKQASDLHGLYFHDWVGLENGSHYFELYSLLHATRTRALEEGLLVAPVKG